MYVHTVRYKHMYSRRDHSAADATATVKEQLGAGRWGPQPPAARVTGNGDGDVPVPSWPTAVAAAVALACGTLVRRAGWSSVREGGRRGAGGGGGAGGCRRPHSSS